MKKWTDIKAQDVDRAQYLKFLYDELGDEDPCQIYQAPSFEALTHKVDTTRILKEAK